MQESYGKRKFRHLAQSGCRMQLAPPCAYLMPKSGWTMLNSGTKLAVKLVVYVKLPQSLSAVMLIQSICKKKRLKLSLNLLLSVIE